jgi:hypothetical protein
MERLIKIGDIAPKCPRDIRFSRLGIGFEKLDRRVFDPEKAYDKLAGIGVKWVRIQSGWERTETEKGKYDFGWIDSIVDRLISEGMIPWMNLVYGNRLYDERAAEVFGGVGCPPIFTEEAHSAWLAYITALTAHFAGRVRYYEIWNEPDGKHCWKHGVNPQEYGKFTLETARAIKAGDPGAKAVGGALCYGNILFADAAAEAGFFDEIDAVSYHCYTASDKAMRDNCSAFTAIAKLYRPDIEVIQGESGTQSRSGGNGALKLGAWSEAKQAKFMARHLVTDLLGGVKFASYFSCMDMIEALHGLNSDKSTYQDYGYFGVLSAQFDENGFSIGEYAPKPSYRTLQTLASVFAEEWSVAALPVLPRPDKSDRIFGSDVNDFNIQSGGFVRPDGSRAYVYWYASDLMTSTYDGTVTLAVAGMPGEVKLIDLLDGGVYKLPDSICEQLGGTRIKLHNLPIKDYPLLLTFGDFYK